MKHSHAAIALASALVLGGCASMPTGPSLMALPGSGRTFEQFRFDDAECQQYAFQQIGGTTAQKAANESATRSAVVGTAVGAVAGADAGQRSGYGTQRQYDNAYVQCMYARGHKVPVSANMARSLQQAPSAASSAYSPPATADGKNIPPPPSGNPPPPPPGY